MIIKPRGTSDILPKDAPIWQDIEKTARSTAELYGYGEIRFPTFESTELFARGVGDTTDVVVSPFSKEAAAMLQMSIAATTASLSRTSTPER